MSSGGSGSASTESSGDQCVLTTFAGSGGTVKDAVGTEAGLWRPQAMCLSKASNSLLFIENTNHVTRVYLPSTPEIRRVLAQSVADGLDEVSPSLACISPLINLIVLYAVSDGK